MSRVDASQIHAVVRRWNDAANSTVDHVPKMLPNGNLSATFVAAKAYFLHDPGNCGF
jgi:hypothetical protein